MGGPGLERQDAAFKQFMQGFWDLSSTDTAMRIDAGLAILRHVQATTLDAPVKASKGDNLEVTARDSAAIYAVNRLMRGVGSSREAARQGFAGCAAEFLSIVPETVVGTKEALDILLESTKATGSLRVHEERDLVLGRLFGCAAFARSGRLAKSEELCVQALDAVAPLYWRRRWMRQAAGQVMLILAGELSPDAFVVQGVPRLAPLLASASPIKTADASSNGAAENASADQKAEENVNRGTPDGSAGSSVEFVAVSDMSADQLAIALGLQRLLLKRGGGGSDKDKLAVLPKALRRPLLRPNRVKELVEPLVSSASVFPRVHAVWGEIWWQLGLNYASLAGEADGSETKGALARRAEALGAAEESVLRALWAAVVDARLASDSHNTKGLALLLVQQVLPLVPASCVSILISPPIARLLANHGVRKSATLHAMASACLELLPDLTADDSAARAAVVAAMVAAGKPLAESRLGSGVLAGLAEGMDEAAVSSHIEVLMATATNAGSGDDARTGTQAVEALYVLTKSVDSASTDGQRDGAKGLSGPCNRIACFFLESGFFEPSGDEGAGAVVSPEVASACRKRFWSVVSDTGRLPLSWVFSPQADPEAKATGRRRQQKKPKQATVVELQSLATEPGALEVLWRLYVHWGELAASGWKVLKDFFSDEEEQSAFVRAAAAVKRMRGRAEAEAALPGETSNTRVESALAGLILYVGLQMLATDAETRSHAADHLLSLLSICSELVPEAMVLEAGDAEGEDASEGVERAEDAMALLAEVLTSVLDSPAQGIARGLRGAAKRAWSAILIEHPVSAAAVGVLRATICGEDAEDEPRDGSEADEGEEAESDDSDDEAEELETPQKPGKGKKASGIESGDGQSDDSSEAGSDSDAPSRPVAEHVAVNGKQRKQSDESGDASEEEEEEDVTLDAEDLEAFLGASDSEDGEGLTHNRGADGALAAILALRRQGRKAGLAQLEREHAQSRLRALDLLQAVCSRQQDNPFLPSLIPVVYASIKPLESGPAASTPQGRAMHDRLVAVLPLLTKGKPKGINLETVEEGAWSPADGVTFFLAELDRFDRRSVSKQARRSKLDDSLLSGLAMQGLMACIRLALRRAELASAAKERMQQLGSASTKKSRKRSRSNSESGDGGQEDAKAPEHPELPAEAIETILAQAKTVTESISSTFESYLSQRRVSKVAGERLAEIIRRFGSITPDVVPVLLSGAKSAETDFLRAEAVRLLSLVLAQRNALGPAARSRLVQTASQIADTLRAVLESKGLPSETKEDSSSPAGQAVTQGEQAKGARAKHVKPVLDCCSALLKMEADERKSGRDGSLEPSDFESLAAVLQATAESSASAAVTGMCRSLAAKGEELAGSQSHKKRAKAGGDAEAGETARSTKGKRRKASL